MGALICFLALLFLLAGFRGIAQSRDTLAKPNVLWVAPVQFTENGFGIGGSYERILGGKGNFSCYVPVMLTFNFANANRIYDFNTGNYKTGKADAMLYAMPGINWYPTGSLGKIKYAAGASLAAGTGQQSSYALNMRGLNTTELVQHHFLAGLVLQQSVHLQLNPHLLASAELGIGQTFINKAGGTTEGAETLVQGNVKIGFRF